MISMTGYGTAERQDERYSVLVEVKSYNNRYLDVNCSLPGALSALEPRIRESVGVVARRGRVEVFLRFRDKDEDLSVSLDRGVARGYVDAIRELRELTGLDEPVRLDHILPREGVLSSERIVDVDSAWLVIQPLLEQALAEFRASREAEGRRLEHDVREQLEKIEECVSAFEAHAAEIETSIRTGLVQRFQEVLGNEVDENRVLAEVAVQLTRYSINEEIVRLHAHLDSFREIGFGAATDGPVGKKLDFICQELNREINTTGSKSIIVEVNQQVVLAKDALENVREQLRNIE